MGDRNQSIRALLRERMASEKVSRIRRGILRSLIGTAEWLKEKFPEKRIRTAASVIMIAVIFIPGFMLISSILAGVIIWDQYDPFSIDINNGLYLIFLLLYGSLIALTVYLLKDVLDIIELIYHPIQAIRDRYIESIIKPFLSYLIKYIIIISLIFGTALIILVSVMISSGFSLLILVILIYLLILYVVLVAVPTALLLLLKWVLTVVIDMILRNIDKKISFRKKWKMFVKYIEGIREDRMELSDETRKEIAESRDEIRRGRVHKLSDIKKEMK